MATSRVAVIGGGIAGLTAAIDLARGGCEVTVFERAAVPGGKLRQVVVGGEPMDAGPTVFTMRRIFDDLFADCGEAFERYVTLVPAQVLARHAWSARERLDLYADFGRSVEAIAAFSSDREAQAYVRFAAHAERIFSTLDATFMRAPRPSPLELMRRIGLRGLPSLWNIKPFDTLWQAAGKYFRDPRLRQLFGRYATYCGSSPFCSPATLMLVAHVERAGVWYVEGGMQSLVAQLAALAARRGVRLLCGTEITRIHLRLGRVNAVETAAGDLIAVDNVVSNADNNALTTGLLGREVMHAARGTPTAARSLSAMTWNVVAPTAGFDLAHHSVFFSTDYRSEFDDLVVRRRMPADPTVYVCAQDRVDVAQRRRGQPERLLCLINAPANGDDHRYDAAEIDSCERRTFQKLQEFGLQVERRSDATQVTTPTDFHRLFPATGGALYGPASHGWRASFARAGSRSTIPGLYLAGGSTHPGPGVPMAATSGRLAAACLLADCASIATFPRAATYGGTSMP